jgi:phosphohistidine phosphatase
MLVYIMRHGEANPGSDGERRLTKLGAIQAKSVLEWARLLGADPSAIASSPLARAKQTAEIAKSVFGIDYKVANSLEPEGSAEEVYEEFSNHHEDKGTLLISHQPLVSKLLSYLLDAEANIAFAEGTVATVQVDRPKSRSGKLLLLIPPRITTT